MITKDLLLVTGNAILFILNVNQHNLVRKINVPGSSMIFCTCILDQNNVLTEDALYSIKQWRIEGDNLKLISVKKNVHNECWFTMKKLRVGLALSGSIGEHSICIWRCYL